MKTFRKATLTAALTVLVLVTALPAVAADIAVDLAAEKTTVTMTNTGESVPMWVYQVNGATVGGAPSAAPIGPTLGFVPVIQAQAGDSLTINLSNNLGAGPGLVEPTSVVIPGQQATETDSMVPTWTDGTTGPRGANLDKRVRSFTHEVADGSSGSYEWADLRAGTYLIKSGTHPAVQVQMGLYAVLKVDDTGQAGAQVHNRAYDNEQFMLFSEIDPGFHATVYNDQYGPGKAVTSTMEYHPTYFLLNGVPYTDAGDLAVSGTAGTDILVRFLNAGLQTRVPQMQGAYMTLLAEDGYPAPFPVDQHSLVLPAGKTFDVLLQSAPSATIPVFDRRLAYSKEAMAPLSVELAPDIAGPQMPGTDVVFTATATGGANLKEYRFYVKGPGDATATLIQNYSTSNTFPWTTPATLGTYTIGVHVRNLGSAASVEAQKWISYKVGVLPATGATLAASPLSPQPSGTAVTFTATATGGSGTYEYRFFVKGPEDATATLVQAYSADNTFDWTTPVTTGFYTIGVQVRSQGSIQAVEAQKWVSYRVVPPAATAATLTADPGSPQLPDVGVNFTAGASGGSGTYEYRFFVKGPEDTTATLAQGYSTSNVFAWTTPTAAGLYTIGVQVRSEGSTEAFEAQEWVSYRVVPPAATAATLSASPSSPQPQDVTVTFTAGASGGSGTYEYRFFVKGPEDATATLVQGYSTNNLFLWTTPTQTGSYTIGVQVRSLGSIEPVEAQKWMTYQVQ